MHVNQMAQAAAEEAQCTWLQADQIIRSLFVEAPLMILEGESWQLEGIGFIQATKRLARWYIDPLTGTWKRSTTHKGLRLAHAKGAILRERAENPIP